MTEPNIIAGIAASGELELGRASEEEIAALREQQTKNEE